MEQLLATHGRKYQNTPTVTKRVDFLMWIEIFMQNISVQNWLHESVSCTKINQTMLCDSEV